MIPGKVFVECPKNREIVDVRKVCVDCGSFGHVSWKGLQPLIECKAQISAPAPETRKNRVGGLKRW